MSFYGKKGKKGARQSARNEAEKRWQEIEEGRVECTPAEAVMKKSRDMD